MKAHEASLARRGSLVHLDRPVLRVIQDHRDPRERKADVARRAMLGRRASRAQLVRVESQALEVKPERRDPKGSRANLDEPGRPEM
jgi:hypothetical protein